MLVFSSNAGLRASYFITPWWLTLLCCHFFFSLHFAAGFFGVQSYQSEYHQLITIESEGFNNTLAPYFHCPNSNNPIGSVQASKWENIYLQSALKRLTPFIRGYQLKLKDLVAMQQLCAYEVNDSLFISFYDIIN